ncbi:MAG: RnfH family protein [Acidiferrobacteraceae bacterium]
MADEEFEVEVVYCGSAHQWRVSVPVLRGTTVEQAIDRSGILDLAPEIDLRRQPIGIFGRPVVLGAPVEPGDRVEIYRALVVGPKERRRMRAGRPRRFNSGD